MTRKVLAAKTKLYVFRKFVFVKSTAAVVVTALLSWSTTHDAASAQPLASEDSGSSVDAVGSVTDPLPAPLFVPFSQYFLARPGIFAHGSAEVVADGVAVDVADCVGVGSAWAVGTNMNSATTPMTADINRRAAVRARAVTSTPRQFR
jgi:hypothetical protein